MMEARLTRLASNAAQTLHASWKSLLTKGTEMAVSKATEEKKPAVKKTAAKPAEPAAKKTTPKKTATAKAASAKTKSSPRKISAEERYKMTEVAAYFLAERNGFKGNPVEYWEQAEAQISQLLG
jgi:cell division septation protein DedD